MSTHLEYTGERMIPQFSDEGTFWEHVERYRFACSMTKEKDVLDVACGAGYGTAALLKSGAKTVIGVDISPEAVAYAKELYNVDARLGTAENLPLPDSTVDLLVSFETIEHIQNPSLFLGECCRVLRSDGTLVISTPNLVVYREGTPENPFHCSEMSVEEFARLMETQFEEVELYGQNVPLQNWKRIRGLGRIANLMRKLSNPIRNVPLSDLNRNKVVEFCSAPSSRLGNYFTSDSVQKVSRKALDNCRFIVAIASRPKK